MPMFNNKVSDLAESNRKLTPIVFNEITNKSSQNGKKSFVICEDHNLDKQVRPSGLVKNFLIVESTFKDEKSVFSDDLSDGEVGSSSNSAVFETTQQHRGVLMGYENPVEQLSYDNINAVKEDNTGNESKWINETHRRMSIALPSFGKIKHFQVTWRDLSYSVKNVYGKRRNILNRVYGNFKSGQMMAIIGPSGCGKSTLLSCITGLRKISVTGTVRISGGNQLKMSLVPQDDHLYPLLTIREQILFASKLKNSSKVDHEDVVDEVMEMLNIEICAHNRPKNCSGGQQKRVSIALEMVSKPDILILDEPTSGLDSSTTKQLIEMLYDLTQFPRPVAVVMTIHQPSAKIFNMFHSLYILSFDGHAIYHGAPKELIPKMTKLGFHCPVYHNPADFMIEVASGDHGWSELNYLAAAFRSRASKQQQLPGEVLEIVRDQRTASHIWHLTVRNLIMALRDPLTVVVRAVILLTVALMFKYIYGTERGRVSGCPQELMAIPEGMTFIEHYIQTSMKIYENVGCIFLICIMHWFGAIFPYLLVLPREMNIVFKEFQNGWYSIFSFFMAKVLVDLPLQLTLPHIFSHIAYTETGQPDDSWRLWIFSIHTVLTALTASTIGLMISALLMNYPAAAVFIGILILMPMAIFSGFMLPVNQMPNFYKIISWGVYLRFILSSEIALLYGKKRCEELVIEQNEEAVNLPKMIESLKPMINLDALGMTEEQLSVGIGLLTGAGQTNETRSIAMVNFGVEDFDLWLGIGMLVVFVFIFRLVTYWTLVKKIDSVH